MTITYVSLDEPLSAHTNATATGDAHSNSLALVPSPARRGFTGALVDTRHVIAQSAREEFQRTCVAYEAEIARLQRRLTEALTAVQALSDDADARLEARRTGTEWHRDDHGA